MLNELLKRLLEHDDISVVRGIFDYLQEDNSIIAQYKYRQLYSAFGILLNRCLDYHPKGKIINITREDVIKDTQLQSMQVMEAVNLLEDNRYDNYNRVLRGLHTFKQRCQEIFWEDITPLEKSLSLIESTIKQCNDKREKSYSRIDQEIQDHSD